MEPERWRQIDEMFHRALEHDAGPRAEFLAGACGGDEALRREVEALLAAHERAESFIETPAGDLAAELLSRTRTALDVGQRIGPFRITSLLGTGGMGEVYLAEDARLGRSVAIKLLLAEAAGDPERRARFEQEARAASALNHPNVCAVYDVGETDEGRHFLAMEYVAGQTLRERLQSSALELTQALDVAAQVAEALAAAHEAGVVHRDVKPENLMLRPDGYVKVLDFGIAKLAEEPSGEAAPVRAPVETTKGAVMGTVTYMSPEQARGLAVDARTDIWSLGAVLYEMLAGRPPFAGATRTDVLVAILEREPEPLASPAGEVPAKVQRIVAKALRKDREQRYPTAAALLTDLKQLRRELEIEAQVGPSKQFTADDEPTVTTSRSHVLAPRLFPAGLSRGRILTLTALVGALIVAGLVSAQLLRGSSTPAPQPEIRSLAVLPLKSLGQDGGEQYLGLGIADAIITKVSQVGGLVVRPTSAVRKYADQGTDALEAARQLQADAVLEGTLQRSGDRLRVSVNLLRTSDATSLWAERFDMRITDVFEIQDAVAQQVASRLRLRLDPSQQARLTKRSTSNPVALGHYARGVYGLDTDLPDKQRTEAAMDDFKRAIEADPEFATAHAQLAVAAAYMAVFVEPNERRWVDLAHEAIERAREIDPQVAETHFAKAMLLWSGHEGYQEEAAVRELLAAQRLNPSGFHAELAWISMHMGLEDLAEREIERALEIDPTRKFPRAIGVYQYFFGARYDDWLAAHQRLSPNEPLDALYLLGTGQLDAAQAALEDLERRQPDYWQLAQGKALLAALRGDFRSAEAAIPKILGAAGPQPINYHHATYTVACIYALQGKSAEAVVWLRRTAEMGMPSYPLFARDPMLDRIRQAPEFVAFIAEMKDQHERYRREFS